MQEECLNKVKEKFAVLTPEEITHQHQYIDAKGTFCFNAMVLDICKGLSHNGTSRQYQEIPNRLEQELGLQPATIHLVNNIHQDWIYDQVEFDEAVAEVLSILGNDGYNEMPDDDEDYDEDEDYDPENEE